MAMKIRGITLEIGGDTQGLSKALSGVNKEISSTQKQLKDVERLLKMDPGNIELLRQKQKLLSDQVENTTTKLEELKKAQASMDASGVDRSTWRCSGRSSQQSRSCGTWKTRQLAPMQSLRRSVLPLIKSHPAQVR